MWMYTDAHYVNEPLICAAQLCNYHTLHFDETIEISKEMVNTVQKWAIA